MDNEKSCQLYLISPPAISLPHFSEELKAALGEGNVGAFQLRLKNAGDEDILNTGKVLLPICRDNQVAFILNDRPDLAKAMGADGVHLGQEDLTNMPIANARAILGEEAVIGVSCHDTRDMAYEAARDGADYVAFGAFFPTRSKSPEKLAKYGTPTAEILEIWHETSIIPSVAIGGITPQNCVPLVRAGADFIAAITSVWSHPQGAVVAVKEFNESIARALA